MKKVACAALAATFAVSLSSAPALSQGLGLIVHSSIVSKCQNRQLTLEEAQRSAIFPFMNIWKALKDCQTASAKK
ncbi:MAG TPA: hypothetical protein VH765_15660 [Xanthobacteraceae bacterium]|jgi:hypothetical protein